MTKGKKMNKIKELENLLRTDVLVEINAEITALEQQLEKKSNKDLQEELTYMQGVKQYFDEVLIDIEHNVLTQEDAVDILENLEEMRAEDEIEEE